MKRFMIEGTGVMNGEVEWTSVTFADTREKALIDARISFERSHGKLAGTQISLNAREQPEYDTEEWRGPDS